MEALLKDPVSYWYQVPRDILGLVKEYLRPIEDYPALPVRGLRYPPGKKPQVSRLSLHSRVVLAGPQTSLESWLWVMDVSRDDQLILRNIDQRSLISYSVTRQEFSLEPITEWDRLINSKPEDNPDPTKTSQRIHHMMSNCQDIYRDLQKNFRMGIYQQRNYLIYTVNPYLDGCGQAIQVRSDGLEKQELYIYPITATSDPKVIPAGTRPLFADSHIIYPFQDPVTFTMYFHVYGKIYRYRGGQLQLILRTHLRHFQMAFINLTGQLILVHAVNRQSVGHLPLISYPFPLLNPSLVTLGTTLIVSVYQ